MERGAWCMVRGAWCVVHGFMVHGEVHSALVRCEVCTDDKRGKREDGGRLAHAKGEGKEQGD